MDLNAMEYLSAVWFIGGRESDWLGFLYRAKADHLWHFDYRFRYYAGSSDPFDGNDRKSWYEGKFEAGRTEDDQIADIELIVSMIAKRQGRDVERVVVKGDPMLLIEKAKGRSWFHLQQRPIV